MKKIIILSALALFAKSESFGQILNQDADGKSSIVAGGGSVNFDITKSLVKANYYSNSNASKAFMWGVDLQGKNADGTAALFDGGKLSPQGDLSVLVGYKISWKTVSGSNLVRFYVRAGIKGSEFTYDAGDTFSTVKSRFLDTVHYGGHLEGGVTLRLGGQFLIGGLVGFSGEDNQSELTSNTYKYTTSSTVISGLQQSKDITALSGNYGKYNSTYINADAMYFFSIDGANYLCPALYFRQNMSGNKTLKPNNTVLGVSLNFIKISSGSFLGGVYVQSNDLKNEDQSPLAKTISFGLNARVSFSSFGF